MMIWRAGELERYSSQHLKLDKKVYQTSDMCREIVDILLLVILSAKKYWFCILPIAGVSVPFSLFLAILMSGGADPALCAVPAPPRQCLSLLHNWLH